jgi:hypothetical protein
MGIYSHACTRASERGTITTVAVLKTTSLHVFIGALRVCISAFDDVPTGESEEQTRAHHKIHHRRQWIDGEGWTGESVTEEEERHQVDGNQDTKSSMPFGLFPQGSSILPM